MSGWKHVWAILALPFTATIIIPTLIYQLLPFDPLAIGQWPTGIVLFFSALAALLLILGLVLVFTTIQLLASVGGGTLAPWNPPRYLVVEGPYRYVRNPMISGVLFILLGQALSLLSLSLLAWFGLFAVVQHIYMTRSEEPGLEKRFGHQYRVYKQKVPRWVPRRTPWLGGA